jgi:Helix-turn-helix domain
MNDTRNIAVGGHDDLLSPEQAAEALRKSLSTLSRWRAEKKGPPYIKNGGTIEYRRSDLENYRLRQLRLAPPTLLTLAR